MSITGKLAITLAIDHNKVSETHIVLSRPQLAEKLLLGLAPEQAIARIEQMFVVCRQAQTAAAQLALTTDEQQHKRLIEKNHLAIRLENIEQYFWRLLLDLPQLVGLELNIQPFIALRQNILAWHKLSNREEKEAQVIKIQQHAERLFNEITHLGSQEFLAMSSQDFSLWLVGSNCPVAQYYQAIDDAQFNQEEVPLLPSVPTESDLLVLLGSMQTDPDFCLRPTFQGEVAQTGALAHSQYYSYLLVNKHQGIKDRLTAKLLGLAQHIRELLSPVLAPNSGVLQQGQQQLAWVHSARGLLLHLANIQDDKVQQYCLCAPTEWNFHPQGILPKLLNHRAVTNLEQAIEQTRLAALILDPCIDFTVGADYA